MKGINPALKIQNLYTVDLPPKPIKMPLKN